MLLENFVLTCFGKRLPFNVTFRNKKKYVASLSSFADLIPVEKNKTGKGGGKNLSFIISRCDDWHGENKLC